MADKINDGGQAFPCVNPHYDGNWNKEAHIHGMSLRDAAALAALPAIITAVCNGHFSKPTGGLFEPFIATTAFEIADAFIAARTRHPEDQQ